MGIVGVSFLIDGVEKVESMFPPFNMAELETESLGKPVFGSCFRTETEMRTVARAPVVLCLHKPS